MNLGNPDTRRGARTVVQAIVVLAMILTVWFNIERLSEAGTESILRWAMVILLVGTVGYIMENGLRSFDFEGWGFKGRASNEAEAKAQGATEAAEAAKDKALELKDNANG